jgi:plasmid stabilization system protein ParE
LDGIWDYLANEANPEIADFVIARLVEAMHRTAGNPYLYAERSEYEGHPRRFTVYDYAVFYEPLPDGEGIFVWRVIHGKRDLARHVQPVS